MQPPAWGLFRPRIGLAGWTGTTGRRIKTDAHDRTPRDVPAAYPLYTQLPLRTTAPGVATFHKAIRLFSRSP